MRKKIIAGNWKMNKNLQEACDLAGAVVDAASNNKDVDIVVCPSYVCLQAVSEIIKDSNVDLGAQDLFWEDKGAFTGKVSADMLKSVGVKYIIIGHSEQRRYFGETDESVNKKLKTALANGLCPIVCVGETQGERENGETENVVAQQIKGAYQGIRAQDALKTVIAYEPVWAIGTGLTATSDQAQEVHAYIRNTLLTNLYDVNTASQIRIQYGGSMKGSNAKELLGQADIDGGLIGGASLKAEDFKAIFDYNV